MMITMTLMISMVVTTIEVLVEAVGVLKFSKNLGATSKF